MDIFTKRPVLSRATWRDPENAIQFLVAISRPEASRDNIRNRARAAGRRLIPSAWSAACSIRIDVYGDPDVHASWTGLRTETND
jgi:hypothetical protein